ncbi:putative membrane protein YdbS, contains bPH2 (bacterial pleckstrin homology) domain [Halapricum desulfuricans]|uniref:Putative membrane protein YdbS, contains bPH2 (Bacterial pleckstrin homology) domain n=1 Tax=Halapricum desulfuricans TaxID=2841257 RepID=A0A897NE13_9EURY|nr:PH domain-containing protein [Halapricum desulfuricans]QSG10912.1 putative membrane protein YdbS, contains bPH2 (bacterial pleckstrin homology) domain [Halapricum desulfuricans]
MDDELADADSEAGEADPSAYTTDVRTLDPRVRWLWVGRALVVALILGAIATAGALAALPQWPWIGPAVFVLVATLGVGHALLLYRSWSYEVREDSMLLDRGVITRIRTVVPYVRVQHIDTSRGPIERAVGLSSLVVYTAGSRGADVTIPGLRPREATDLQTRLKALAIESEGEDAV